MRNSKNLEIFWQTASSRTPSAVAIESAISCAMTGIPHGGCRQLAAEYHSVFQTKRRRTACQRKELVLQLSRSSWYIRLNKQGKWNADQFSSVHGYSLLFNNSKDRFWRHGTYSWRRLTKQKYRNPFAVEIARLTACRSNLPFCFWRLWTNSCRAYKNRTTK